MGSESQPATGVGSLQAHVSTLLKRYDDDPMFQDLQTGSPSKNLSTHDWDEEEKRNSRRHAAWNHFIKLRGSRYAGCTLENFQQNEKSDAAVGRLLAFCERMPESLDRNLILLGPSGTGKDHLLTGCVRKAIKSGLTSVGWTSGPVLYSALRRGISENRPEDETIRPLLKCRLLVFSDMAMTSLSDYQREIVYRIIDHRYNNRLATWVSANVTDRESFEAATSPQIVDRLIDEAVYVPCNWESYRKVAGLNATG